MFKKKINVLSNFPQAQDDILKEQFNHKMKIQSLSTHLDASRKSGEVL